MRLARALRAVGMTAFCVFAAASVAQAETSANWPQFRGTDSLGVSDNPNLPDTWAAEPAKNIEWKTDVPGRGWSCPIVWGKRVFLTTVVNQGQTPEAKKGLYFGGESKKAPDSVHQWKVLCLDLETGKQLWERQVHEGIPATPIHVKNSYASETPVTDGKFLYAMFGNLGLWCLDLDGNVVWKHEITPHKTRFDWGTAASPVLHEDRVYMVNDNDEESYLLALDKATGKEIWRVVRDEGSNWSSPYIWVNEKRTEIVTPGSRRVRSYDLDGKELWSFKGMSMITIATPFSANGLLYISSGYVGDKRRPLYAIRPGATGDISLVKDDAGQGPTSNEWIAWSAPQGAPYNPSTLAYRDRLYVLFDGGWFAAYDAKDGSPIYERQRIPDGKGFTCSPWAYNGKIFCLNEDGVTFVINAGNVFEPLHQNALAADDMGMATPAIAGDRLLIRTSARVYSIRNAGAK